VILQTLHRSDWTILAVQNPDGACEFLAELDEVSDTMKDGVLTLLERVAKRGPRSLTSENCHHLDGAISQFRKGRHRVLWFSDEGKVIVCSHSFMKKTPKTPKGEITRAAKLYERYQAAKADGKLVIVEDESE
jgi:phage-related protein